MKYATRIIRSSLIYGFLIGICSCGADAQVYKDSHKPIEERINDLIAKMTLEEKVMQLNQYTLGRNNNENNVGETVKKIPAEIGSLIYSDSDPGLRNQVQAKAMKESRLGIPIIFGFDVLHGYRTVYPISLAQACSWNPDLVSQACSVAAAEARLSGVDWTFSPMIDVAHDGRWGRVAEGYGEDPYANGIFGAASVKGYQGSDLRNQNTIAACLKHYVGYGASEAGRDYVYTEISKETLWNLYLPPYEAGIKAGAATVMSSFNDISGTPGSANHYTLTDILKDRWKHDGFVVSDWGSVQQLRSQGVAATVEEAAKKAFNAGVEMDMMNQAYDNHLADLVKSGEVSEERLNDAVKRVLRIKFRLRLFDNPYTPELPKEKRFLTKEYRAVAEKLAEESMVLLKNKDNTLPIKNVSKIAVIGPIAKSGVQFLGSWSAHGDAMDVVTIYEGLQAAYGTKTELLFAQGCRLDEDDTTGFAEAVAMSQKADVVFLCLGENRGWSGENSSRSTLALPHIQLDLLKEIAKTGKKIVLILSNGRPIELTAMEPLCDAILEVWQPGVAGGTAIGKILSGKVNPSGKLAMTFPYSTGQIPIYYNHRQSARPTQGLYQDIPSTPLYDFGYGLSYTTYAYSDIKISKAKLKGAEKMIAEITVTNTGTMDGYETVHWFIRDPACTISRPVKELKYFEKKMIKKGETVTYSFEIDPMRDLSFLDSDGKRFLETGEYYIMVQEKKVSIEITE